MREEEEIDTLSSQISLFVVLLLSISGGSEVPSFK